MWTSERFPHSSECAKNCEKSRDFVTTKGASRFSIGFIVYGALCNIEGSHVSKI